ncbi:MFS general substrate transporter [Marasmius fiardii PR-910]|nr:MFS general substrate transporter [Marasmius fiardii PR-910]
MANIEAEESERGLRRTTPLPKLQVTLALLMFLAEPVTATVIYPFIPAFVRRTGATENDEKKTGYYAGIIESLLFISECLCVLHWNRASDRIGRRPILLLGPLALSVAMLAFGLSKTFWQLVVSRCVQGVFNGILGVVRTVLVEITDDTNIADALTLMALTWTVGITIGPAMGGFLSDPAERWPQIFGSEFFKANPYFLPCAGAATIAFVGFLLSFFFLEETLKTRLINHGDREPSDSETHPFLDQSQELTPSPEEEPPLTVYRIISLNPHLRRCLISHAVHAFTNMSHTVLIPLVYSTSIPNGGLGLSPYQIGVILGTFGVCNGVLQFTVWNPLLKRIGPKRMFLLSYTFHIVRVVLMMFARIAAARAGKLNGLVWMLIVAQMGSSTLAATAFNSISTLIVKSSPQDVLGTINGIQQMISSGLRGMAPTIASSLFAASLALDSRISGRGVGGVWRYSVDLSQVFVIGAAVWYSLRLPSYRLL